MKNKLISTFLIIILLISFPALTASAGDTSAQGFVQTLSLGCGHSAVVTEAGYLYTWGNNSDRQLGFGDTIDRNIPTRVPGLCNIKFVSLGTSHSAAITQDGYLYTWGANDYGQLGRGYLGDISERRLPERVPGLEHVVAVSLGKLHSAAITENGSLYMWGDNVVAPIRVSEIYNVSAVSLGHNHSIALTSDGQLHTWGANEFGQLGLGDTSDSAVPKRVPGLYNIAAISADQNRTAAITQSGELFIWGQNHTLQAFPNGGGFVSSPAPVPGISNVSAVGLGQAFTLAIADGGRLYTWGYNINGSLGQARREVGREDYIDLPLRILGYSGAVAISAGLDRAAFLYINAVVYIWGNNTYGRLGLADRTNRDIPTRLITNINVPQGACICIPSPWAAPVIGAVRELGMLQPGQMRNYRCEVGRIEVARLFISLIEAVTGQSIDDFKSYKGVSIDENAFIDTADPAALSAHALGIFYGQGSGRFNPNGILRRAEIAAVINRTAVLLGVDTSGHSHNFIDMSGHWAEAELGWPVYAEIILGMGYGEFRPERNLTAEEAIVIVYRAFYTIFLHSR